MRLITFAVEVRLITFAAASLKTVFAFSLPEIFTCPGTQQISISSFLNLGCAIIALMSYTIGDVDVLDFRVNKVL